MPWEDLEGDHRERVGVQLADDRLEGGLLKEGLGTPVCHDHVRVLERTDEQRADIGDVERNDTTAHGAIGERDDVVTEAIIDDDQWLGQIVDKLQESGILEQTLIYVTTDHGFDEATYDHINAPYGILATNDPLVIRSGDRKDVAATILKRYGLSLGPDGDIPGVDGYPLDSIPPIPCVSEGDAYIDYPSSPTCCSNLELISLDIHKPGRCLPATAGQVTTPVIAQSAVMGYVRSLRMTVIAGKIVISIGGPTRSACP